jgi:hypothetical protein
VGQLVRVVESTRCGVVRDTRTRQWAQPASRPQGSERRPPVAASPPLSARCAAGGPAPACARRSARQHPGRTRSRPLRSSSVVAVPGRGIAARVMVSPTG